LVLPLHAKVISPSSYDSNIAIAVDNEAEVIAAEQENNPTPENLPPINPNAFSNSSSYEPPQHQMQPNHGPANNQPPTDLSDFDAENTEGDFEAVPSNEEFLQTVANWSLPELKQQQDEFWSKDDFYSLLPTLTRLCEVEPTVSEHFFRAAICHYYVGNLTEGLGLLNQAELLNHPKSQIQKEKLWFLLLNLSSLPTPEEYNQEKQNVMSFIEQIEITNSTAFSAAVNEQILPLIPPTELETKQNFFANLPFFITSLIHGGWNQFLPGFAQSMLQEEKTTTPINENTILFPLGKEQLLTAIDFMNLEIIPDRSTPFFMTILTKSNSTNSQFLPELLELQTKHPRNIQLSLQIGAVKQQNNLEDLGLTHFLEAEKLRPLDPRPLLRMTEREIGLQQFSVARSHLEQIFSLYPAHTEAHALLTLIDSLENDKIITTKKITKSTQKKRDKPTTQTVDGFIHEKKVKIAKQNQVIIIDSGWLYRGNSLATKRLHKVTKNSKATILSTVGDWVHIKINSTEK
jgi:hypothetical protein